MASLTYPGRSRHQHPPGRKVGWAAAAGFPVSRHNKTGLFLSFSTSTAALGNVVAAQVSEFFEADALYGTASEMRLAIAVLHQTKIAGLPTLFLGTVQFLMGFAAELYLKSALARANVPAKDRHGHDLRELFDKADELHLLTFSEKGQLAEVVAHLRDEHKKNSWRYGSSTGTYHTLTNVSAAVGVFDSLDAHLRKSIDLALVSKHMPTAPLTF